MKGPPSNLVLLDFSDPDTISLLEDLLDMARKGKISGMVFSVLISTRRKRRVILGSTGRASHNLIEATGLSALLHCRLTTAAMESIEHHSTNS